MPVSAPQERPLLLLKYGLFELLYSQRQLVGVFAKDAYMAIKHEFNIFAKCL